MFPLHKTKSFNLQLHLQCQILGVFSNLCDPMILFYGQGTGKEELEK